MEISTKFGNIYITLEKEKTDFQNRNIGRSLLTLQMFEELYLIPTN
jgi:hypothetical protein